MKGALTVFRHEWAGFWRGGVAALIVLIVGVIGIGVVLVEHQNWQSEQAERAELQAQEVEQWLALGDTHIHKAAHRGYFVIRDLSPGVILDRGVWDFGGSAIWLEAHRRNAPKLRAADDTVLLARGAPRGVGPVLLWLTPLLLVVLLHGIVAGERTRGSLAFAVSSGASPPAIITGKALAAITLAWAAALAPMAVGLSLTIGAGLSLMSAALWAAGMLTALAIFASLVLTVSAFARRPLDALVALLLIWFVMAVLWPRMTPGLAASIEPIPSSQTIRSQAEVVAEGLVSEETEQAVLTQLAAAGIDNPNPSGVSAMAAEIDAAAAFAEIFAQLETGMARQADLLDVLAWLSPLSSADRAGDVKLGLSDRDQFAFETRAEDMRIATQMALNEGWARAPANGRGNPALWANVVDAAGIASAAASESGFAVWGLVIWTGLAGLGLVGASRAVRRSI